MNEKLKELMQAFVNAEYSQLVTIAKGALATAYPYIAKICAESDADDENLASKVFLHFIGTTLAADGYYTELENKFFCDITGDTDSYEANKAYVAQYANSDSQSIADKLFDEVVNDDNARVALLHLCLAICAIDETISVEEVKFIQKLID